MLATLVERMTFGQWLSQELRAREMGAGHLAAIGSISRTAVYAYLKDDRIPDTRQCSIIASVLRLPVAEVLYRAGHAPEPAESIELPPPSVDLHPDLEVKLKLFTPEEQRRWVLPMLDLALTLREDSEAYDEPPPGTPEPPPPLPPPAPPRPSR